MAATSQVQILVRTSNSWKELGGSRLGQCPWGCLQGQLAHDRLTETLKPSGLPVDGGGTLLIEQKGCWLGPRGSGVSACASPVVTGLSALAPLTATLSSPAEPA